MAAFPCPYCGHALVSDDADAKLERCPSCDGSLLIAYRHRLIASRGKISGGALYEAVDDGFGERVAVLFVEQQSDAAAVERFVEGNRLFADLGGRGLVKIHDVGTASDRRPYVVMDWLTGGTLDKLVQKSGALPQARLLELVGDLLTGVSKAHRAMPAIVHGHIHPGKVGFRRNDEVVLFGFEWATQVNAQASRLADSFVSGTDDQRRGPESDLRQLGVVFVHAATGEWIGELDVDRQRERVRAQLPGPLGRLVDRMLGAGVDGYKNAVEAAIDFEQLLRGVDSWQATARRQDRSEERMGTAWVPDQHDDDEDHDEEPVEELSGRDFYQVEDDEPSTPARRSTAPQVSDWTKLAAQRQAQALAQAAKPQANHGRTLAVALGFMMVLGTCVAAIVADVEDHSTPPPNQRGVPRQVVATPPPPIEIPEISELPEIEPPPAYVPPRPLAGVFRYTGKVTGPEAFAGLGLDSRCEIWIEPNDEDELNCRWYIDCGKPKRRIYGGGDVGYSSCEVDDEGRPLRAQDDDDDAADGAFLADFTVDPPMLVFEDRWIEPPVRVFISITGGGRNSGSIPNVKLAPRDSQEQIQQRIDRGESPVIEPGVIADW